MKNRLKRIIAIITLFFFVPSFVFASANTHSAQFVAASSQALYASSNLGWTGGAVTISGWFKLSSTGTNFQLFDLNDNTNKVEFDSYLDNFGGATYKYAVNRAQIGIAGCTTGSTSVTLNTTTWHQYAATYDATNEKIYVDGTLVGGPLACSGNGSAAAANLFEIGRACTAGNCSTFGSYLDGFEDDVRAYSVDIGATAVAALYNSPSNVTGSETNLTDGYNFNPDLTSDVGSGAHNLTNLNTVTQSTNVPFTGLSPVPPKVPNLINFSYYKPEHIFHLA